MSINNWFRTQSDRVFRVGDRVEWDGRDRGTVIGILDADSLAVEYDDPALGRAMAPAWSKRLQRLEVLEIESVWDEPTIPYALWDGQTLVEEIV